MDDPSRKKRVTLEFGGEVLQSISELAAARGQEVSQFVLDAISHEKWIRETIGKGHKIILYDGKDLRAVDFQFNIGR